MPRTGLRDHIVICGWSETTEAIVNQLHSEDVAEQRHVVIIDNKITECPIDDPYVYFVHGDPTEDETLLRACVPTAGTAIILADWSLPDASLRDSKTALVTLAIESMNRDVYTCAEVMRSESKRHLERADVDEPICVADLSQRMLVMAALNHGLSRLFDDILTFNRGSEIYCTPLPSAYDGLTFRRLVADLSSQHGLIVMGLRRGDDIHTNPPGRFTLEPGDALFLLAESYPEDIEDFAPAPASSSEPANAQPEAEREL
jgi:voltage-gated potassium channel